MAKSFAWPRAPRRTVRMITELMAERLQLQGIILPGRNEPGKQLAGLSAVSKRDASARRTTSSDWSGLKVTGHDFL